jgi:hypothetical protein
MKNRSSRRLLSTTEGKIAPSSGPGSVAVSTQPQPVKVTPTPVPPKVESGGSTFFQRFSSFLAGCGVGFGVTYYFLLNEVEEGNARLMREISQFKDAYEVKK